MASVGVCVMDTKGLAAKLRHAKKRLHEANLDRRRLALENRELRERIDRMDSCWVHGCAHDGVACARAHLTTTSAATPARPAADPDPGADPATAPGSSISPSQPPQTAPATPSVPWTAEGNSRKQNDRPAATGRS